MSWQRPPKKAWDGLTALGPSEPPAEEDVNQALRSLVVHAQSPFGEARPEFAPGRDDEGLPPLNYAYDVGRALSELNRHLDLHLSFEQLYQRPSWLSYNLALTGSLCDAVEIARSLSDEDRERYLDLLCYGFQQPGVWPALASLNRHYRVEIMPCFTEQLRSDDTPHSELELRCLFSVSLDPSPELADYMPAMFEAVRENRIGFFRALTTAFDWRPGKPMPLEDFVKLPQGKQSTARVRARRHWVSLGLWMLQPDLLFVGFPELSQSAQGKLYSPSSGDGLYRSVHYTAFRSATRELCGENAPTIPASVFNFT